MVELVRANQLNCLGILCTYFQLIEDQKPDAKNAVALLRQILQMYDPLGAFEKEYLDRIHYQLTETESFIPSITVPNGPNPVTFQELEVTLNLPTEAFVDLATIHSALVHGDPEIRALSDYHVGIEVYLYSVLHALQKAIHSYYRQLAQAAILTDDARDIRQACALVKKRLQNSPLQRITRDALLGNNLDSYRIHLSPIRS